MIEAREAVSRVPTATIYPGVVVKYNGSGTSSKKSTGFKAGKTYWAEIFTFPVDNIHSDSVTFQLREKGHHVVSSDWMGEVTLKLSEYDDGNVHLKWFRLGESKAKQHTHKGKGVLLLKVHLAGKNDKPFYKKPSERQLSYDEWIEWSEAQYANSHRGRGEEEEYPVVDNRIRSTSMRGLKEGKDRREDFARNRSKSTSEAVREPSEEKQKRLAKSTEEEEKAAKPRPPISPVTSTPPAVPGKNEMLIDLSTPEVTIFLLFSSRLVPTGGDR